MKYELMKCIDSVMLFILERGYVYVDVTCSIKLLGNLFLQSKNKCNVTVAFSNIQNPQVLLSPCCDPASYLTSPLCVLARPFLQTSGRTCPRL